MLQNGTVNALSVLTYILTHLVCQVAMPSNTKNIQSIVD